jgi:crotonobetainyl-CoA:carnitine CoA-transferase CaiB-like acyl-CoA transferase
MVAGRLGTAKAWQSLIDWLVEELGAGAAELQEEWWLELPNRQSEHGIRRFGEIFGRFLATRLRADLYAEAQRRGIALSPVNDVPAVMADPQLQARDFWVAVDDPQVGRTLTYPGPPYRLSATPPLPARPAPRPGEHNLAVLRDRLDLTSDEYEQLLEAGVI